METFDSLIKTKGFLESGVSLKLISLLIVVLTVVFAMDNKSHVYLYIFCYTPIYGYQILTSPIINHVFNYNT